MVSFTWYFALLCKLGRLQIMNQILQIELQKLIKNPNQWEADQLAIYKNGEVANGFETTEFKSEEL